MANRLDHGGHVLHRGDARHHARLFSPGLWFALAFALALCYWWWAVSGRGLSTATPVLNVSVVEAIGSDEGAGNLIAIEPWMTPADYASERAFTSKLTGYFQVAQNRGWLHSNSIVVLPEYLGTWLVAADEKTSVYTASTMSRAMAIIAATNAIPTAERAIESPANDRLRYAVLSFKADKMAAMYDRCLSKLAKTYGVTVVGGSIALPAPRVERGHLRSGRGALANVCPLYRPDGTADARLVHKCFPTVDERPFVAQRCPQTSPCSTPRLESSEF